MTSILLLAFALSAETSPAQVRADLDGQGGVEIATAAASGRRVRLEVRDARGTLEGPNALSRVPVRCQRAPEPLSHDARAPDRGRRFGVSGPA